MGWIKNTVLGATLLATGVSAHAQQHTPDQLQEKLAQTSWLQEQYFGITHESLPAVEIGLPAHYPDSAGKYVAATYAPHTDSINVGKNFLECVEKPKCYYRPEEVLAKTLRHELGHNYANEAARQLGIGPWPNIQTTLEEIFENPWDAEAWYRATRRHQATKVLSEGIATYYEMPAWRVRVSKPMNWSKIDTLYTDHYYAGGYHVVKPILDKHGKRGLEYIVTHVPDSPQAFENYTLKALEELGGLEEHQARILVDLNELTGTLYAPLEQRK